VALPTPTEWSARETPGVVDPDVESIGSGLRAIGSMRTDELQAMGRRARTLLDQEFRWERTAQLLLAAYLEATVTRSS
jgi:glycosyltransferase involved in cell wall biosynthesis